MLCLPFLQCHEDPLMKMRMRGGQHRKQEEATVKERSQIKEPALKFLMLSVSTVKTFSNSTIWTFIWRR